MEVMEREQRVKEAEQSLERRDDIVFSLGTLHWRSPSIRYQRKTDLPALKTTSTIGVLKRRIFVFSRR